MHTEAQIIAALKQAEASRTVEDVGRACGVSAATIYAWKAKYGGDRGDRTIRCGSSWCDWPRLSDIASAGWNARESDNEAFHDLTRNGVFGNVVIREARTCRKPDFSGTTR
jgi:hypothetical protein